MRTTHWMVCTLLGAALALTAYVEDDKDLSQPKEPEKTTDLIISDDADWITTGSVNLSITSPVATRVAIYTGESCTSASLLTELPVSEATKNIRLDVAKTNRALYVQYATSKRREMMNTPLNAASTRTETLVKLSENVSGFDTNGEEGIYRYQWCPTKGETAALMVEDNWPEMGDYDFNGFIIWYHTRAIFFDGGNEDKGSYETDGIGFEIAFRAIGGYLPYRLGLQLDQTSVKYIDEMTEIGRNDLVKVELQDPGRNAPAIFTLTGTDQLRKQSNGGTFYNTEADHQIAANDLVTVKYRLKINCFSSLEGAKALWATAISENQNFFLQKERNGGREIHLKDYESAAYYSDSYAGEAGSSIHSDIKYCSTGSFVWGIKVPVRLAYPRGEKDIMEAYGRFRSWITNPNLSPDSPNFNEDWLKYLDSSQAVKQAIKHFIP